MPNTRLASLITPTPQAGVDLVVKLSRIQTKFSFTPHKIVVAAKTQLTMSRRKTA
jgi:Hexameric tyrosine-coordinated heme protein (HTHP)